MFPGFPAIPWPESLRRLAESTNNAFDAEARAQALTRATRASVAAAVTAGCAWMSFTHSDPALLAVENDTPTRDLDGDELVAATTKATSLPAFSAENDAMRAWLGSIVRGVVVPAAAQLLLDTLPDGPLASAADTVLTTPLVLPVAVAVVAAAPGIADTWRDTGSYGAVASHTATVAASAAKSSAAAAVGSQLGCAVAAASACSNPVVAAALSGVAAAGMKHAVASASWDMLPAPPPRFAPFFSAIEAQA